MHRLVVALLGLLQARGAVSAETYHDVLGLGPNSALGAAELKSAYRKRSLELHPDKPGGSVDRFRLLQEAYETLKDEQSRKYYAAFGMVWKQVKEYQEKYLTGRRQVIQRTRYGMQLAIEEFEIREPMGDIWAGARLNVVPMHGDYAQAALAQDGGVWAVLIGSDNSHESRLAASAFGGFCRAQKRVKCGSVNALVQGNEGLVNSLVKEPQLRRVPRIVLVAPQPNATLWGGAADRLVDVVEVDAEPRSSLPLRIQRVADFLARSVQGVTILPGSAAGAVDVVLAVDKAAPLLFSALRRLSTKYAPILTFALRECTAQEPCAPTARFEGADFPGGYPRLELASAFGAPGGEAESVELEDGATFGSDPASALSALVDGAFLAARARLVPNRVPQSLTVGGMAKFGCESNGQLTGKYVYKQSLRGRGVWKHTTLEFYLRWQPAAQRSRGVGAWLLTDVLSDDRAWAYLESDLHAPTPDASDACWTFYCAKTQKWECQPAFTITPSAPAMRTQEL